MNRCHSWLRPFKCDESEATGGHWTPCHFRQSRRWNVHRRIASVKIRNGKLYGSHAPHAAIHIEVGLLHIPNPLHTTRRRVIVTVMQLLRGVSYASNVCQLFYIIMIHSTPASLKRVRVMGNLIAAVAAGDIGHHCDRGLCGNITAYKHCQFAFQNGVACTCGPLSRAMTSEQTIKPGSVLIKVVVWIDEGHTVCAMSGSIAMHVPILMASAHKSTQIHTMPSPKQAAISQPGWLDVPSRVPTCHQDSLKAYACACQC
jgi:hypothetical protein